MDRSTHLQRVRVGFVDAGLHGVRADASRATSILPAGGDVDVEAHALRARRDGQLVDVANATGHLKSPSAHLQQVVVQGDATGRGHLPSSPATQLKHPEAGATRSLRRRGRELHLEGMPTHGASWAEDDLPSRNGETEGAQLRVQGHRSLSRPCGRRVQHVEQLVAPWTELERRPAAGSEDEVECDRVSIPVGEGEQVPQRQRAAEAAIWEGDDGGRGCLNNEQRWRRRGGGR